MSASNSLPHPHHTPNRRRRGRARHVHHHHLIKVAGQRNVALLGCAQRVHHGHGHRGKGSVRVAVDVHVDVREAVWMSGEYP